MYSFYFFIIKCSVGCVFLKKRYYLQLLREKDKLLNKIILDNIRLKKELEYYKRSNYTDSLTKLYNRRIIDNSHDYSAVVFADIDYFKVINDKYGHDCGDKVLIEVSKLLKQIIDENDIPCRWGGEEFVILVKKNNKNSPIELANKMKKHLQLLKEKFGFPITMSIGISYIKNDDIKEAIIEADDAMYESKNQGRNKISIYKLK